MQITDQSRVAKFQGISYLNIDLEKQTDAGGCLVCIPSVCFSSYKLEPAKGTSFLQNRLRLLCFREQREELQRVSVTLSLSTRRLNAVWIPGQGRSNQHTSKSQNPSAEALNPELYFPAIKIPFQVLIFLLNSF